MMTKEEFNELMKIDGEVRGMGIKSHAEFILQKEGQAGLKKLEETITGLGYPVRYEKMRLMDFYPIGLEIATLLVIKRVFNYEDAEFQEIGRFGVKISFLLKLFMRYFVSPEKLIKMASNVWKKGGALGDFEVVQYDKDKKHLVLRIENFNVHPVYCQIFIGYFSKGLQMIMGKEAICEETKCTFRGDNSHEFTLRW